jgi:hypothetical protein
MAAVEGTSAANMAKEQEEKYQLKKAEYEAIIE